MSGKKGPLQKIMDAVGDAVQAVATVVGLTEPEPAPVPKSKAVRKAAVAMVEQAREAAKNARLATRRGR